MTGTDVEAIADAVAERLLRGRDERPLMSPAQVADRIGLSERTVRELLSTGRIPSFKVEGARKIEPAAVDGYLEAQKAASDG